VALASRLYRTRLLAGELEKIATDVARTVTLSVLKSLGKKTRSPSILLYAKANHWLDALSQVCKPEYHEKSLEIQSATDSIKYWHVSFWRHSTTALTAMWRDGKATLCLLLRSTNGVSTSLR